MWGNQLWDPRAPTLLHQFDSFTSFATGHFHPSGPPAQGFESLVVIEILHSAGVYGILQNFGRHHV